MKTGVYRDPDGAQADGNASQLKIKACANNSAASSSVSVRISFMLIFIKLMLILTNSFVEQCVQFNQMKAFAADALPLVDAV